MSLRSIVISITVVVCAIVYMLESPLQPYLWKHPFELPAWNEEWQLNEQLIGVDKLVVNQLQGPESFVLHPNASIPVLYTSVMGGMVVEVATNGSYVRNLFFIGGYLRKCRGNGLMETDLVQYCREQTEAGNMAWNESNEYACGRPLGLRIKQIQEDQHLYVMDAYHGLFRLNLSSCTAHGNPGSCQIRHLFNAKIRLELPSPMWRPANKSEEKPKELYSLPPKFFNDFDISQSDGCIYFTDSSYMWSRSNNRIEILDGAPRGRLLRYCGPGISGPVNMNEGKQNKPGVCRVDTGLIEVLLCGLHFPNGVQFLDEGSTLLVAETTRFRILKLNITAIVPVKRNIPSGKTDKLRNFDVVRQGSCRGNTPDGTYISIDSYLPRQQAKAFGPVIKNGVDVFIDALPGGPDNIRKNPANGNILIGAGFKSAKPFSLLYSAYQSYWLRVLIGKLIPMRYIEHFVPKYGLVLVVNSAGDPVDCYHDPSGRISMISEAQFHQETGDLWLGSHSNNYLGVDRLMSQSNLLNDISSEEKDIMDRVHNEDVKFYEYLKDEKERMYDEEN